MVATLKTLKRKYVRVSSAATITHLKKFIAKKVLDGMDKYKDVSIGKFFSIINFLKLNIWLL